MPLTLPAAVGGLPSFLLSIFETRVVDERFCYGFWSDFQYFVEILDIEGWRRVFV